MDIYEVSVLLGKGFLNNLAVTVLVCVLSIGWGILWCLLSKTHITSRRIIGGVHQIWESFCPLVCLYVSYYFLARSVAVPPFVVTVLTLTVCFCGFLPARQNKNNSFGKNVIVNTVDLIPTVFMWSLVSSCIGNSELVRAAQKIVSTTFRFEIYLVVAGIVFLFVLPFKVLKFILNETMQ